MRQNHGTAEGIWRFAISADVLESFTVTIAVPSLLTVAKISTKAGDVESNPSILKETSPSTSDPLKIWKNPVS